MLNKKHNNIIEILLVVIHILYFSNAIIFLAKKGLLPVNPSVIIFTICIISIGSIARKIKSYKDIKIFVGLYKPYILIFFIYVLYLLIGYAYTENGVEEIFLPALIILTSTTIIFQYVYGIITIKKLKIVFFASFLLLLITTAIDIIHPHTFYENGDRAGGLGVNPNNTAFMMVIILLLINITFKNKAIIYITLIGTILTIAFTLSRGGMILLSLYLLIRLLFWKRNIAFNKSVILLVFVFITGFIFIDPASLINKVTNETTLNRVNSILNSRNDVLEDSRVSLVKKYYILSLEKPIFGNSALKAKDTSIAEVGPHNTYLLFFYEIGIVGVIFLIWLLLRNITFFYRRNFFTGYLFWLLIGVQFIFTHDLLYTYFFGFSVAYVYIFYLEERKIKLALKKQQAFK